MRSGAPRAILEEGRRGQLRRCEARTRSGMPDRGSLLGYLRPSRGHRGGRRIPRQVWVPVEYGSESLRGLGLARRVTRGSNGARCCAHLILVRILCSIHLRDPAMLKFYAIYNLPTENDILNK